jgi:hypothetical protein
MPWVGFEPTITASEQAKTVHALERSATVTGLIKKLPVQNRIRRNSFGSRHVNVPTNNIKSWGGFSRRTIFTWTADIKHNAEYAGGGQNNGNTNKLRNRICAGYTERTSVENTECSSACLHSIVLMSVH